MTDELSPTEADSELNETMLELLRKNILSQILKLDKSFLTGSNYWYSDFHEICKHSDYDICTLEINRHEVEEIIKTFNLKSKPGTYNNGIYIKVGGYNKINVIFLGNDNINAWKKTTDIMEFLVKEFDCIKRNKKVRVGVFQSLVALIKMLEAI